MFSNHIILVKHCDYCYYSGALQYRGRAKLVLSLVVLHGKNYNLCFTIQYRILQIIILSAVKRTYIPLLKAILNTLCILQKYIVLDLNPMVICGNVNLEELKMTFLYFTLFITLILSLFTLLLTLLKYFPKLWSILLVLKKYNIIAKFIVCSQIFHYHIYHKSNILTVKGFRRLMHLVTFITFFGTMFRLTLLKEHYFYLPEEPLSILFIFILIIICINTLFRSFNNFAGFIYDTEIIIYLLENNFFSNIKKNPFWDAQVKKLFIISKLRIIYFKKYNKKI